MTGGEDCFNGVDDDGDGQIDCADPDCSANSCVEQAPAGWSGPVAFSLGAGAPPACGAPWIAADSYHGGMLTAPGSQCQCSCSSPQGSCVENVMFYTDDSCAILDGTLFYLTNACGVPFNATHTSAMVGMPQPSGATCGAALGGGCGAGSVCAPAPPPQFPSHLCVSQAGDVACPGGAFTDRHVVYTNADDTRSCSACSCGPASGVGCQGKVSFYSDPSCTNEINGGGPGCYGGAPFHSVKSTYVPSGGGCQPVGGALNGGVVPEGALTVCCTPAQP
jgi:hypothetical protein